MYRYGLSTVYDHKITVTNLIDQTWRAVRRIQYYFGLLIKYSLTAFGIFQFSGNIGPSFFFCGLAHMVIHDNPLAERFVGTLVERDIQARLPDEKDHRKVPGVHFKVKHSLEVGQDFMAEHIRFINDDHGSDPFFEGIPFDFPLDVIEKIALSKTWFRAEPERKLPVEIHNGQCGKTAVGNFE